jgi:hypothetical protein
VRVNISSWELTIFTPTMFVNIMLAKCFEDLTNNAHWVLFRTHLSFAFYSVVSVVFTKDKRGKDYLK